MTTIALYKTWFALENISVHRDGPVPKSLDCYLRQNALWKLFLRCWNLWSFSFFHKLCKDNKGSRFSHLAERPTWVALGLRRSTISEFSLTLGCVGSVCLHVKKLRPANWYLNEMKAMEQIRTVLSHAGYQNLKHPRKATKICQLWINDSFFMKPESAGPHLECSICFRRVTTV